LRPVAKANLAGAAWRGEVSYPYGHSTNSICPPEYPAEQIAFALLYVAPQGIATQIRELDHAGQPAIHEQGRLDYSIDARPKSTLCMKVSHEIGVLLGHCLVVVMHQ